MNNTIPTVIVSAFPACGKTTLSKLYPNYFRDLESSNYHWIYLKSGEKEASPDWPRNYIDTIKLLDGSGMYQKVFVSSHELIRKEMKKAGIRYINVVPQDTPEMKKIMLDRMKKRGNTQFFIDDQEEHWSERIKEMIEDPGASNILQLTPQIINRWGEMYCLE